MNENNDDRPDEIEDEELQEIVDMVDEHVDDSDPAADPNGERDSQGRRPENPAPEPREVVDTDVPESSDYNIHTHDENDDDAGGTGLWGSLAGVFLAPLSKLPRKKKIYQGMIKAGYEGIYKNTSAQVVVNTIYGDRYVIPRPAELDENEGKVRTDNGEEWSLPDGLQTYRIGDASMMWGVADSHELVSPVGARTAEKIDLDDAVYVRSIERDQQGPTASAGRGQQALADGGGLSGLRAYSMDRWNGEMFDDVLVNWSNHNPDADGMVVSMEKHYELQHSQAGSEEMKKQEDRGRLAERMGDGRKSALIYVALYIAGILTMMFGPQVASRVGGGNGDDGGSSVSLSMEAMAFLPQMVI